LKPFVELCLYFSNQTPVSPQTSSRTVLSRRPPTWRMAPRSWPRRPGVARATGARSWYSWWSLW